MKVQKAVGYSKLLIAFLELQNNAELPLLLNRETKTVTPEGENKEFTTVSALFMIKKVSMMFNLPIIKAPMVTYTTIIGGNRNL